MANPTTAKPTGNFAEWLSTAATVGENMRCFIPMLASGLMRDVVGSVIGVPFVGIAGHGTGHPPAVVANGFTQGAVTNDPVYRFGVGATGVRFAGRGFSSAVVATMLATIPTFYAVVKPFGNANAVGIRTSPLFGSGQDIFGTYVGYQISAAGVITLGLIKANAFESSTITITSGKTYVIACTITSSTGRIWQVYCDDDQAYVTTQATGLVVVGTALSSASQNLDFMINPTPGFDTIGSVAPLCDMYCCGLHLGTMDPATNAYFAALVADHVAPARGTYTSTGTLAAGTICNWDTSTSKVTLHSNRPTLGTAGDQNRYQYRLHRSLTTSFTPGVGTRIGSLQSSPVLEDTTAVAGTTYWYAAEQTDGTSTVYSTTSSAPGSAGTGSNQRVSGRLSRGDALIGFIGDSRTATTWPAYFATCLAAWGWRVGVINRAVSGTAVYNSSTAASSWQPNTTQDPTNGQSGTTLLANAMAEFAQAGVTDILSDIGVNDSSAGNIAATFQTRYGYLLAQLTPLYRCYLAYPYTRQDFPALEALVQPYYAVIDALANGTTIFKYDTTSAECIDERDIGYYASDGLHIIYKTLNGVAFARSYARNVLGDIPTTSRIIGG